METSMPAIFFGHGNPMNAIEESDYTRGWAQIGAEIPRPKAVLMVSAHWYVPYTAVTADAAPRTIHDFGGFPRPLFEVQYPAPGEPDLAAQVREMLAPVEVGLDQDWGLDHGTWAVLRHVFPDADVPVVQLSIDRAKAPEFHYKLAKGLAPLREEGFLIAGSGNVVHNLHMYAWGKENVEPFDWAVTFEQTLREKISNRDHRPLVDYERLGREALLSAPTPDHYLPLLYVLALQKDEDEVSFPVEGFDGGSVSMLSVRIG